MWTVSLNILKMIITVLKYPFYLLLILIAVFSFLISINIVKGLTKGKRFKKGEHNKVKKESVLKRIFVRFPEQFVYDLFEKDPEFFRYQGMVIFER